MPHPGTERAIARVTGQVQGVNFRAAAAREARRHCLTGWVRNERDGSVVIEVEGDPAAVEAFLDWCAIGPPAARVDAVETRPAAPIGFEEFRILRPEQS
jgi:acylphosphatase